MCGARGRRILLLTTIGLGGCSAFVDWGALEGAPGPVEAGAPDGGPPSDGGGSSKGDGALSEGGDRTDAEASRGDLVLDWAFDEATGSVVADGSGHGHTGTATGGSWVADRKGQAGKAYAFGGGSSIVATPGSVDLDRVAGGAFTLMAWVRFDGTPNHTVFVSVEYGAKEAAFGIEMLSATSINFWDGVGHIAQADGIVNVVGGWHHTAVVVSGANTRLFVDGVIVGQGLADPTPRTATRFVAGRSNYDATLPGAIDDVRFFRTALGDAQVLAEKDR